MEKVNYLEHTTKVKYGDGLLEHSQEWQWLIDEIEERFEIKEIDSWEQYLCESAPIREVFGYFVKILEVCDKSWTYSKKEFEEIWKIARFYVGSIDVNDCINKISHNQCKLFFWCIWITKLENGDNESKYLYDIRILGQKNYFELIKYDSLLEVNTELVNYANTISISGLDAPLKCLNDNLNQIEYQCDDEFLKHYEKEILNYNAFSFQNISKKECQTWQELYLLDMLGISFDKRKIQPMFSSGNITTPDITMWNREILEKIKKYFNNIIANFIVESISYIKFDIEPSKEIKLLHCKLLLEALNNEKEGDSFFASSSYCVLSYLFQDKLMKDCCKEKDYILLIKEMQKWKDPLWIMDLKENGFPIEKQQRIYLSEFLANKYKKIEEVFSINELLEYLGDLAITKEITNEYLRKISEKFKKYTEEDQQDITVSSVYYEYMVFLITVNQTNSNIDKRYVQTEMIDIQKTWQRKIYKRQCENMHEFSYEQKIKTETLEKFSDMALLNPIMFAQNCTPTSEEQILKIMMSISEHPLVYLAKGMTISPIFPGESDKIVYERHDIDNLLLNCVNDLKIKKGYKLLNQFDAEKFVSGIHNRYKKNTQSALTLFRKEKELYNVVRTETNIELLPYTDTPSLALLTQLFPVLEIKIRELVTLFGIFPFKKKMDEFMQYNDPSSLLRELLTSLFDKQHSFENVPDLIYVYNIMYNGNSCNVRNECIHGRDYLSGGSFKFAFRATLFAIHMIDFRIRTIRENVSDIIEMAE